MSWSGNTHGALHLRLEQHVAQFFIVQNSNVMYNKSFMNCSNLRNCKSLANVLLQPTDYRISVNNNVKKGGEL